MRLRIISDGTPRGTRVLTSGGEMVHGVQAVEWIGAIDQPVAVVKLTLRANVELDVEGETDDSGGTQ